MAGLTGVGGHFSPDGSRIVFSRAGSGEGRIYLVDTDGTDQVRITDGHGDSDAHLGSVSEVSAGLLHSIALVTPGTVWGWGSNTFGQLGPGAGAGAGPVNTLRVKAKG